jgi:serine/threonine protein kinase
MKVLLRNGSRSVRVELGRELGKGAAGRIYEVVSRPDLVAKVYFDPATGRPSHRLAREQYDRVDAMLRNPPRVGEPHQEGGRSFHQLAWPTDHVLNLSGEALGFAMPMLPLKHACDLEAILTKKARERENLPHELIVRLYVARNLAAVVRELHKAGHYVIDMKPKNMSVYRIASPGLIAMLDADGFSVYGGPGERYPAEMFTSEYIAPELLANNRKPGEAREEQDRWALAVIIFRLLNENLHPYSGVYSGGDSPVIDEHVRNWRYAYGRTPHPELRPPVFSMHELFDDDTRELFDRAFGRDPYSRPEAREWRNHLDLFTDPAKGRLLQCKVDPSHWHFSKGCGLCHREEVLTGRTTQRSVPPKHWRPAASPAPKPRPTSPLRPVSPPHSAPLPRSRSRLRSLAAWTLGALVTVFALAIGLSVLLPMAAERERTVNINARPPGPPGATQRQVSDRSPQLSLHSGPGERYPAVAQIPAGEVVTLTEVGRGPMPAWTKVSWRGREGYVQSARLVPVGTVSSRSPATTSAPSANSAPAGRVTTNSRPPDPPVAVPPTRPQQKPQERATEPAVAAASQTADRAPSAATGVANGSQPDVSAPTAAGGRSGESVRSDPLPTLFPDTTATSSGTTSTGTRPPGDKGSPGTAAAGNDALLTECQGWVTKGRYALEEGSPDAALAFADHALRLRSGCPGAFALKQQAEGAKLMGLRRNGPN